MTDKQASDDVAVDLSMRRTGMSFQRTRMSADRTLMSVIRTSLSLISFGFTIVQFFQKLKESDVLASAARTARAISAQHWCGSASPCCLRHRVSRPVHEGLRKTRAEMKRHRLIHGDSHFPMSLTLIAAVILLVIGVAAIAAWFATSDRFESLARS